MVLSVGFALVLEFVGMRILGDPTSVPSLIYELAKQWIIAIVGASILTTLYGHNVEKRPLV